MNFSGPNFLGANLLRLQASALTLGYRAVSLCASCECGQRLEDDENLAAHLYSDEIAVMDERNDVFLRQAELKASFGKRYEQRVRRFHAASFAGGRGVVKRTRN
jgi:hypothetical protein